jgi:radical SAM superfamily enzyme
MERHAAIDVCVMGEAEETAAQVFAKLLDGGVLDDTQAGVAFRQDGRVICTALPPLVGAREPGLDGALDITPSPYLSGILADGQEGVLTGRGCTHHCQYCCFAALGRKLLRLHSIERVVAELEYIAAHQKRTGEHYPVAIQDDAFTLLPPRATALCQAIADRKLNLVFSCITRADTVDEELIRLMKEAGFGSITFGLESAVPSVLRAIGKVRPPDWHDLDLAPERQFLDRVRNSVLIAKQCGFKVGVSIILGLPTETPADGAETLRFVKELQVDTYTHNFLWVFPGTPLWATHKKHGINCIVDKTGLPTTTGYSYDLKTLKPAPKCELEQEVHLIRLLATDALYGCDASSAGKGIGAVIIKASELSPEMAEWLRGILTVGGIVVQVYPAMTRSEWSLRLSCDCGVLNEHLVPAQHYIQVLPKKNKNHDEGWEITGASADVYHAHKPALLAIRTSGDATPLIAWTKGQEAKATVCEISKYLQQPNELIQLMKRIEGEETSSPLQRMPVPPQVKCPGRWLAGKAPCSSLTRIEISGRGEVRCCRQGEPIGKVGDSSEVLAKRLAHLASAVERRRGCAKCRNRHCPRCPFPGIDDRTYCGIMARQERSQQALNWMRLYSRLPLLLARQAVG